MHLAESLPTQDSRVKPDRILLILWFAGAAIAAFFALLFVLHRIGLPIQLVHIGFAVFFALGVSVLAWLGRTIIGDLFFFARRAANVPAIGMGGSADWIGGAVLTLLMGLSLSSKYVLAPALVLGLLIQAILFAMAFRRSNVATLPGFFDWRYNNQFAGLSVLTVSVVVLSLIVLAEFSVARDVMANLAGLTRFHAAVLVLLLAVLPAIVGGWLSLVIVNAVLSVWILISIIVPASLTAFLPKSIVSIAAPQSVATNFSPLNYSSDLVLAAPASGLLFLAVLALAAGFSALPMGFSRLATVNKPVEAIQTLSFSALVVFLVLAIFPLSIGLISTVPTSNSLASALQSQKVLLMLPYVGLLLIAYNALAATLLTLASTIIRGIRRSRRLDPGVQSIFATRAAALAVCVIVFLLVGTLPMNAGEILLAAVAVSAGGLFPPLVAAVWLSNIHSLVSAVASILGAGAAGALVYFKIVASSGDAAAAGLAVGFAVIALGRVAATLFARNGIKDEKLSFLRRPDDAL